MSAAGFGAALPPPAYRLLELAALPGLAAGRRRALAGGAVAAFRKQARRLPELALVHGPVTADTAQLSAYQHLVGASGTDDLPAGYVHVLGFPLSMALMTRPDFPLPALGMVHIANRVTQRRPLRFGESLTFTAWADGLRPHRRGALVDVHLTASAADDVVWSGTSTYLAKGVRVPGAEGAGEVQRVDVFVVPVGRHVWRLPADTGKRYAEISGDRNPIHTSRLGAKAFGFPRPIAHGMYTAARALAAVPQPVGPFEWGVEFAKPVLLPATVVLEFGPREGGTAFTARSRSGRVHFSGLVGSLDS